MSLPRSLDCLPLELVTLQADGQFEMLNSLRIRGESEVEVGEWGSITSRVLRWRNGWLVRQTALPPLVTSPGTVRDHALPSPSPTLTCSLVSFRSSPTLSTSTCRQTAIIPRWRPIFSPGKRFYNSSSGSVLPQWAGSWHEKWCCCRHPAGRGQFCWGTRSGSCRPCSPDEYIDTI